MAYNSLPLSVAELQYFEQLKSRVDASSPPVQNVTPVQQTVDPAVIEAAVANTLAKYNLMPPQQPRTVEQVKETPEKQETPHWLMQFALLDELFLRPLGKEDFSDLTRGFKEALLGNGGDMEKTIKAYKSAAIGFFRTEEGMDVVRIGVAAFLKAIRKHTDAEKTV